MMNFLDESFWLAISFVIFLYLIYRPIKKIILKSLDNKVLEVQERVLKAEKLKEEAFLLFEQTTEQIKKLETIRSNMMQEGHKATEKIIEERNKEIEEFLEHKKAEVITLISNQTITANKELQDKFCDKVIELVTAYFQSTKDSGVLDSDIAKSLMDNPKN